MVAMTVLFALWLTGCGPKVKTNTPAGVSFASYATIAYGGRQGPPEGFERATLPPKAMAQALAAARDTLTAGGWKETSVEEADVVVYAGTGRRLQGERSGGYTGVNFEVMVEKGAIVLDAFDRETGELLWQGQVEGTIKPPIDDFPALRQAVAALLERFPAPGSK